LFIRFKIKLSFFILQTTLEYTNQACFLFHISSDICHDKTYMQKAPSFTEKKGVFGLFIFFDLGRV